MVWLLFSCRNVSFISRNSGREASPMRCFQLSENSIWGDVGAGGNVDAILRWTFCWSAPHSDNCSPNSINVIHAHTKEIIVNQVTQGGYDFQSVSSNVVTSGPNSLLSSNEEAAGSLNKQMVNWKSEKQLSFCLQLALALQHPLFWLMHFK